MKTLNVLLIMLLFFTLKTEAQTKGHVGLYLTQADYLNHKLSYADSQDHIYFHEFLGGKNITVIVGGKKLTLAKNEVYGYRDADNSDYRFFNNEAYRVIDTTGFYLYSCNKAVQQVKGPAVTKLYYFSSLVGSEIQPLSVNNLCRTFSKNQHFRNELSAEFKSDDELPTYDNLSHSYKIKELYAESR
ncbi:hypothetical protein MUY27_08710 [Mucilaginibacter sp. RS28]|uniref:DKNYY family protein n=1 Tax=Mucilaginibacter straminoryzae TaxID=2932774 RepID=A0A9X1X205_9SPHI|nr:hypothetical protein [Mucilaginibacter straminoryzae]MCJ8209787.1 hypothetical protein [Mucilaginibacter straminoryzae]